MGAAPSIKDLYHSQTPLLSQQHEDRIYNIKAYQQK